MDGRVDRWAEREREREREERNRKERRENEWEERERREEGGRKEPDKKGEKRKGGEGGGRMNEIQERMDAWAKGGIERESKEATKQQRNMIQIMVYQTLGKLGCSRTKNE